MSTHNMTSRGWIILYHLQRKYTIIIPFFLSCFSSIMAFQRQSSSDVSFSKCYTNTPWPQLQHHLSWQESGDEHAEGTGSGQPVSGLASPIRQVQLVAQELGETIFSDERNEISFKPSSKLCLYFWVSFQVIAQNLGLTRLWWKCFSYQCQTFRSQSLGWIPTRHLLYSRHCMRFSSVWKTNLK